MGQTSNYGLKQWETWEVPGQASANAALTAIDGALAGLCAAIDQVEALAESRADLVFGSYTGTGTSKRTINLGFTPAWIFVLRETGEADTGNGGLAAPGFPAIRDSSKNAISVVTNGIQVGYEFSYGPWTNDSGTVFYYIAAR